MKTKLALAAFTLCCSLSFAQSPTEHPDSAAFLYHACQLRLRFLDDQTFKPNPHEISEALMCDSYIEGFTDGSIASGGSCIRPVTRETAIRKYVAFLTTNPALLTRDKIGSVAIVLGDLYRCSPKR